MAVELFTIAPSTPIQSGTIPLPIQRIANDVISPDLSRPNLLKNGGFEDWPNGPGPFTGEGQPTADGWFLMANRNGEVAIHQQVASTAPAGSASAARVTGTSAQANLIAQTIDPSVCALNGITVSLSFLANAPVGSQVNAIVGIVGQIGFQLPTLAEGTGTWQRVELTADIPYGPPQPVTVVLGGYGQFDFDFDNASLVVGSTPADYQPTLPRPGPQGTEGVQGPTGSQGPAGPQGPVGPGRIWHGAWSADNAYSVNFLVSYDDGSVYVCIEQCDPHVGNAPPDDAIHWQLFAAGGSPGAAGIQGPPGVDGPAGPAGPIGPQGDPGQPGQQGSQGAAGPQGDVGPEGPQGAQGSFGPAGPAGPQGDVGPAGAQGDPGPAGPQGVQGDPGPVGPQGQPGQTQATYSAIWSWSNNLSVPPNSAQVRSNSGDWATATLLHIDDNDTSNVDHSAQIGRIKPGDNIHLQQKTDATRYATFEVTADPVLQAPSYWDIQVSLTDSGGTISSSGADIQLSLITAGLSPAAWFTGSGSPSAAVGQIGDYYLQDEGTVWTNTDQGGWQATATNIRGPQGTPGPTGALGVVGPAGQDGAAGPQGPQGVAGVQGAAGSDGATGPQGAAGPTGPIGPAGPAGAQGPQGGAGLQGAAGAQGTQGVQGPKGDSGPPGPIGPAGPQGVTGSAGAQGTQGVAGPQGPQGLQGPQGPVGVVLAGSVDGATSGPTTVSTSFATIPDMTVSVSPTATTTLRAWLSITVSSSSNSAVIAIGLALDATTERGVVNVIVPTANTGRVTLTIFAVWTGVAAGTHAINGRWSTTTGTLTGVTTLRHLMVEQAA